MIVMYNLEILNGKLNMIYNYITLGQEWKLPILHESLKVKVKVKDENFDLNNFVDLNHD